MTSTEFAAAVTELGWNQTQAAEALGVTPGAVSRWVSGQRMIPGPVRIIIQWEVRQQRKRDARKRRAHA